MKLVGPMDQAVVRRDNWRLARRVLIGIVVVAILVIVISVLLASGSGNSGGLHH